MKWAAGYKRQREAGWLSASPDSESCRVQKTPSLLFLCSLRSSKLTPQPPCIFHDLCWLTSSLSLPLLDPLRTNRISHAPPHILSLSNWAISWKPQKPSVSPIRSLIQNGVSSRATARAEEILKWMKERRKWEWMKQKRSSAKHDVLHLVYR